MKQAKISDHLASMRGTSVRPRESNPPTPAQGFRTASEKDRGARQTVSPAKLSSSSFHPSARLSSAPVNDYYISEAEDELLSKLRVLPSMQNVSVRKSADAIGAGELNLSPIKPITPPARDSAKAQREVERSSAQRTAAVPQPSLLQHTAAEVIHAVGPSTAAAGVPPDHINVSELSSSSGVADQKLLPLSQRPFRLPSALTQTLGPRSRRARRSEPLPLLPKQVPNSLIEFLVAGDRLPKASEPQEQSGQRRVLSKSTFSTPPTQIHFEFSGQEFLYEEQELAVADPLLGVNFSFLSVEEPDLALLEALPPPQRKRPTPEEKAVRVENVPAPVVVKEASAPKEAEKSAKSPRSQEKAAVRVPPTKAEAAARAKKWGKPKPGKGKQTTLPRVRASSTPILVEAPRQVFTFKLTEPVGCALFRKSQTLRAASERKPPPKPKPAATVAPAKARAGPRGRGAKPATRAAVNHLPNGNIIYTLNEDFYFLEKLLEFSTLCEEDPSLTKYAFVGKLHGRTQRTYYAIRKRMERLQQTTALFRFSLFFYCLRFREEAAQRKLAGAGERFAVEHVNPDHHISGKEREYVDFLAKAFARKLPSSLGYLRGLADGVAEAGSAPADPSTQLSAEEYFHSRYLKRYVQRLFEGLAPPGDDLAQYDFSLKERVVLSEVLAEVGKLTQLSGFEPLDLLGKRELPGEAELEEFAAQAQGPPAQAVLLQLSLPLRLVELLRALVERASMKSGLGQRTVMNILELKIEQ